MIMDVPQKPRTQKCPLKKSRPSRLCEWSRTPTFQHFVDGEIVYPTFGFNMTKKQNQPLKRANGFDILYLMQLGSFQKSCFWIFDRTMLSVKPLQTQPFCHFVGKQWVYPSHSQRVFMTPSP